MTKPILIPLPVPWQIASGYSCLRLEAWEMGSGQPTRVSLNAFFGPVGAVRDEDGFVVPGYSDEPGKEGEYREVEIIFHGTIAARFLPSYSDSEIIPENAYDWSEIDVDYSIDDGVDEFRRRFRSTWQRIGRCPDPAAYLIQSSDWLPLVTLEPSNIKHYMICGNDNYIEILASGYSWKVKRTCSEAPTG